MCVLYSPLPLCASGWRVQDNNNNNNTNLCIVSDKTGITTALLRPERPLSVVLPEFLKWLHITTQEYKEASSCDHYPGFSEMH